MYKMLVLYMDGTLLDSNKKITEKNKLALKVAIDYGTKVVIYTGRALLGVTDYQKVIDLIREDEYTIGCAVQ